MDTEYKAEPLEGGLEQDTMPDWERELLEQFNRLYGRTRKQ